MTVTIDETEIYKTGTKGTVTFKFVNKGLIDIKFLNVIIEDTEDYDIISTEEVYIGNVDSDDFESVEYDLYVTGTEDITIPLKIEYMDANNKEFSETRNVNLKLYDSGDAKKYGLQESSSIGYIIIVIIIAVGLFIYWRWRK